MKRFKVFARVTGLGVLYVLAGVGVNSLPGPDAGSLTRGAAEAVAFVLTGMGGLLGLLATAFTFVATDDEVEKFGGRVV